MNCNTIFKDILFNVKIEKRSYVCLTVDVKISYHNNYDDDVEFELMFYYKNNDVIFDELLWDNFINDYKNNISKKINPSYDVPFGYQGYKFKFNSFRFKKYEFNKFTSKIEQFIVLKYSNYSIYIKDIHDKNYLILKLNELKNKIANIISHIKNNI